MATSHSFEFYRNIGLIYPYVIYSIVTLTAVLIVPLLVMCCNSTAARTFMFSVSKIIFSEMKKKKIGEKVKCFVFKAQLNDSALTATYWVGMFSLTGSLLVAWDVLIMDETSKCDDDYDCFDSNHTYIEDCTEFKNEKVSCFKLTFQSNLAIAAAGGVLALSSKIAGFLGVMLLPIFRDRIIRYDKIEKKYRFSRVYFAILFALPLIVQTAIGIISYFTPKHCTSRDTVTSAVYNTM